MLSVPETNTLHKLERKPIYTPVTATERFCKDATLVNYSEPHPRETLRRIKISLGQ
jgi:hypothetical protein